jgi:RNA polymerase sigma-70 factor (ECF subfamily)
MEAVTMEATAAQLAPRTQPLDHTMIGRLFEQHGDQVYRFCVRVLGCEHDAADAVQNTFLNLARRQSLVSGDEESQRFYLFATARNACFDLRRRRRGDTSLDALRDAGVPFEDTSHACDVQPEQQAIDRDARARLYTALAGLPERQRTAWVLRELADLTYDEIAERLDMNVNAVAQLLHRARRALQSSLLASGSL